jgi:hypothetical protein
MYSKVAKYTFGLGLLYFTLRMYGSDSINALVSAFFWVFLSGLSFELFFKKYGKDVASRPEENGQYWGDSSDSSGDYSDSGGDD